MRELWLALCMWMGALAAATAEAGEMPLALYCYVLPMQAGAVYSHSANLVVRLDERNGAAQVTIIPDEMAIRVDEPLEAVTFALRSYPDLWRLQRSENVWPTALSIVRKPNRQGRFEGLIDDQRDRLVCTPHGA